MACVGIGGQLFQWEVGIPVGTGCAPLLADWFLCSCGNGFLDGLIGKGKRRLVGEFDL